MAVAASVAYASDISPTTRRTAESGRERVWILRPARRGKMGRSEGSLYVSADDP